MGTLFLDQIKKQASSFIHEKYQTARLTFTDVTRAELLAEEATNNDPWGPDAKTMTMLAEASFDVDDYWRIVDVLHKRFESIDWKAWRQSYKSLTLLEFLLTHGPEEFAKEFQCDIDVIEELGMFQFIDAKGFNWGAKMQKRSYDLLQLLVGGEALKEARSKALKITKEIRGFGNFVSSPSASSSNSSSPVSSRSSFGSIFSFNSIRDEDVDITNRLEKLSPTKEDEDYHQYEAVEEGKSNHITTSNGCYIDCDKGMGGISHIWEWSPIQEKEGFMGSKIEGLSPTKKSSYGEDHQKKVARSFSDVGRLMKKRYERQFSIGY